MSAERSGSRPVTQQDPVVEVADQDPFAQVPQNGLQPGPLLFAAGTGPGHGLDDFCAGAGELPGDIFGGV